MAGVEPPPPPVPPPTGLAAARAVRPRRASAKRSWPPDCGRFPAPPPPPQPPAPVAGDDGNNGVDGIANPSRADEVAVVASRFPVSPPRPVVAGDDGEKGVNGSVEGRGGDDGEKGVNGSVEGRGGDDGEKGVNGSVEGRGGDDGEKGAIGSVKGRGGDDGKKGAIGSVEGRGGDDGEKGFHGVAEGRQEEVVAPAAVEETACNGTLQRGPSQPEVERMEVEEGEGRDMGERPLPNDRDALMSNDQGVSLVFDVMPLAVAAPITCGANVSNSSAENVSDAASLLMDRRGGLGGSEFMRKEVTSDIASQEMKHRVGVGELQRKEDDVHDGGRKKRWLMSAMNPPPKRRAVSAIRKFPPNCGRSAATLAGSEDKKELPLEATPISVATSGVFMEDALARTPISVQGASLVPGLDHSSEAIDGRTIEDDESSMAGNRIQEFQVATNASLDDFEGAENGSTCWNDIVRKPSPRHGFVEKVNGKGSSQEKKLVARAVGGGKMTRKCEGRLQEGTLETRTRELVDVKAKHKLLKSDKMNGALQDGARLSRDGIIERNASSTQRTAVRSDMNMKQGDIARKVDATYKCKGTTKRPIEGAKSGKHVTTNQIEDDDRDLVSDRIIVQALMAPDKCPWKQGRKSVGSASQSRTPKHNLKKKIGGPRKELKDATPRKELSLVAATSKAIKHEATKDSYLEDGGNSKDSYSEDEGNSKSLVHNRGKALVVRGGKKELCVALPPCAPSGSDPRSKIRNVLQRFQAACRKLMQVEEQHRANIARIDIEAVNALKQNGYTKPGPIVGNVAGVEVGDEFHFRIELSIVGLHRPYQAGIDMTKVNGNLIAISIVASGGYHDQLSSSDELIYTGSGGKAIGNRAAEDQKLERGNLALKNCIDTKTPVRVIHGFKGHAKSEASHSKTKQISTYIYDGLYMVVDCWQEGTKGSMVFKYKLHRIPGQPELALHIIKATRKSKVREGTCVPDISQGRERIPISVVNTIDDMQPEPFMYTAEVIYPDSYAKEPPKGCDCTNGCADSDRCACAVKNGGEIPFNFSGAIVEARPLIYECGPSCRCPPTCHNRVSQHGIKITLEIFKTGEKGWGVRSLSSISSGSFVCEYTGEILQDNEDDQVENDEYLFDIGHNYHDEVWEGSKSGIYGLESSTSETTEDGGEGTTIDASKCSNVGRFINHSCSPNLFAQCVLWDHDDLKIPHIMFFASENIPPLQELTYDYNYKVGKLKDKNGKEKVKPCFCGSPDCSGRLY
ncbi:uncharacterized protein LOC102720354 [Oryza brachyantha]|uniref:uncharacterized protein LOC102720354 n=1 Tax=Oryza brachyantha TaxID=4533 RepID=UPI001ADC363D|nr:uncharacterized protein LOC102720354 [Oryza brachyantha]